ncbi:prepilin-type N-terminal cleavage/methylation domain-containing protein [Halobacillus yeomjeoni]|uniref:prepilin-type N-terminal cleavage/methylation domain-containing protein n=1 Tax=Halobacillus yeomjeoni TaxID=311194 RepID=UPI0021E61E9B|nr:prepilin-type N-terminal cleavage/methylation domain-containing protein [Halobacillus yeomjeoni]
MGKIKSLLRNEKGFTLIELLAVIVILGIIAAIAVPAIGGIIGNTKEDAHKQNGLSLIESARLAQANDLATGAVGDGDTGYTMTILVDNGYLEEVPQDPEGDGEYTSGYVAIDGSTYTVQLVDSDGTDVWDAPQSKSDLTE